MTGSLYLLSHPTYILIMYLKIASRIIKSLMVKKCQILDVIGMLIGFI